MHAAGEQTRSADLCFSLADLTLGDSPLPHTVGTFAVEYPSLHRLMTTYELMADA